jgi:hypothetical protein
MLNVALAALYRRDIEDWAHITNLPMNNKYMHV